MVAVEFLDHALGFVEGEEFGNADTDESRISHSLANPIPYPLDTPPPPPGIIKLTSSTQHP